MSIDTPSIMVVEDHVIFTSALLRLLKKGNVEVRAVANSAEQALEKLSEVKVDLVLVDISLPHMSGLELVSEICRLYPDLPCMILSGHVASHYVRRSLGVGARGYVVKDNIEGIFEGIRRISQGEIYVGDGLNEGID